MAVEITCQSAQGGAVKLSQVHNVWASYAVATAGDLPPPECLMVGITLKCGRHLDLFVNRETGLVRVSSTDKDETGGVELLHTVVGRARPPGRRFRLKPLGLVREDADARDANRDLVEEGEGLGEGQQQAGE